MTTKFLVSFTIELDAETIEDAQRQLAIGMAFDAKQLITNFKITKENENGDFQTNKQ